MQRAVQRRLLILVPLNYSASRNAGGIWVLLWDAALARAKPSAWQTEAWQSAAGRGNVPPARWQTRPVNGELVSELVCSLCFAFCTAAEPSKSQTRKPKCGKGTHCSRNAYMLVYRLQTREKSLTIEVPGKRALTLLASPFCLCCSRRAGSQGFPRSPFCICCL